MKIFRVSWQRENNCTTEQEFYSTLQLAWERKKILSKDSSNVVNIEEFQMFDEVQQDIEIKKISFLFKEGAYVKDGVNDNIKTHRTKTHEPIESRIFYNVRIIKD